MADIFTEEKRRELMRKVKNRNTNIELLLRKELFKRGFRYKLNSKLFGKPDIVFISKKIAIFCDGDFWHGKNYKKEKDGYKEFWLNKILTNIKRDKLVNKTLISQGWLVLRFWKTDILKNVSKCADIVEKALLEKIT